MPITLYQIDGTLVPPVADARLYELLSGGAVGIVQGCEVTSLGGNQLQITSGWGVCLGRVFQIEQETVNAAVSTGGEVPGRLMISIDVSGGETPAALVTQAQSPMPELVQENINQDGSIYQIPIAEYTVSELAISGLKEVAPRVGSPTLYTYTALLRLDAWSGSAEAGYTQTVAAESIDGGPAVTSALRLYAPLREPTGVKSTDETLAEVLRIVSEGVAETGAGTVTLTVWEKPTADLQVYWQGKEVAAE